MANPDAVVMNELVFWGGVAFALVSMGLAAWFDHRIHVLEQRLHDLHAWRGDMPATIAKQIVRAIRDTHTLGGA